MDTPQFYDGQFVNGLLLDNAMAAVASGIADIGVSLHTPGLLNPSDLVFTPSGLTVQISAPSPFAVLFSSGFLSQAYGTVAGEVTSTYSVNLSSFVPGSGTQTVYIVAEHLQIGEELVTVVGPPQGHPDYDPAFNPFEAYSVDRDTISIVATTTAPDNETAIELFRVTLTVGQVTITSGQIITSYQVYASAVLDPTGVVSGTYVGATVTVGTDGRVTGISGVAYGPLASANTWTQPQTINTPSGDLVGLTVSDSGTYGANILLVGNGSTTPSKYIRAITGVLQFINSAYTLALATLDDVGNFTAAAAISTAATVTGGAVNSTGNMNVAGTLTGGNVDVGGTVTGAAVNSTGNMNVAGTLTGGNVDVGGTVEGSQVTSSGNMYVAGTLTGGNVDVGGTVEGSQVTSSGNMYVGGTLSGGNVNVGGDVIAGGTASGSQVTSTGNIYVVGTLSGGAVNVGGTVTGGSNGSFNGTTIGLLGDGNYGIQTPNGAYFDFDTNASTPAYGNFFTTVGIVAAIVSAINGSTYTDMYAANFVVSSDEVNKTNIQALSAENAIAFVTGISAKMFNRNGNLEAGFVAQDIQNSSFNHMVRNMPANSKSKMGSQLGINATDPIAYHHVALQQLLSRVEALESKVPA